VTGSPSPATVGGYEKTDDITKSELDPLLYRYVKLPNEIKILLISDANADTCAASLSVGSGMEDFHIEKIPKQ